MSDRNRPSSGREQARAVPTDLAVVLVLVASTDVLVLAPVAETGSIRVALSLLLALFLPGYALVAALFPENDRTVTDSPRSDDYTSRGRLSISRSISGLERALLSVGASIAVVPLLGLALDATPLGLRLVPVTLSISAFTAIAAVVAVFRRRALPEGERFAIPFRRWLGRAGTALRPRSNLDWLLNVVLVLSLLILASTVGYTLVVPSENERFTEFYLLTENASGELVADGYPTNFARGEPEPLVVGVSNNEGQPTNYTVVVELQRVGPGNDTTTVVEQRQLHRFEMRVGSNGTQFRRHTVDPMLTGSRLRLTYLLYRGPPPSNPATENAYREIHLWIDVSTNESSTTSPSLATRSFSFTAVTRK